MAGQIDKITLEGVELLFENFAGNEIKVKNKVMNQEGSRNFCVYLNDDIADKLEKDGWLVKHTVANEQYEQESRPYIKVHISASGRPSDSMIVMISGDDKVRLKDESISLLDGADITNADMIIRGWEYEPGKVSAYLKSGYFTVYQDELEKKYGSMY